MFRMITVRAFLLFAGTALAPSMSHAGDGFWDIFGGRPRIFDDGNWNGPEAGRHWGQAFGDVGRDASAVVGGVAGIPGGPGGIAGGATAGWAAGTEFRNGMYAGAAVMPSIPPPPQFQPQFQPPQDQPGFQPQPTPAFEPQPVTTRTDVFIDNPTEGPIVYSMHTIGYSDFRPNRVEAGMTDSQWGSGPIQIRFDDGQGRQVLYDMANNTRYEFRWVYGRLDLFVKPAPASVPAPARAPEANVLPLKDRRVSIENPGGYDRQFSYKTTFDSGWSNFALKAGQTLNMTYRGDLTVQFDDGTNTGTYVSFRLESGSSYRFGWEGRVTLESK